jgi:streptogramin lyase
MKDVILRNCTGCHEANIALQNRFDERGWEAIIDAMSRVSTAGIFAGEGQPPNRALSYFKRDLAAFLAEMRGPGSSPARPGTPLRPSGDATLPVVYEYDVPFESTDGYSPNNGSDWSRGPMSGSGGGIGLHDAQPDRDGNLWLSDNTEGSVMRTVAKVDGRTGAVTNYKVAGRAGGAGHAHGITVARDGMVWFTLSVSEPFSTGGVEQEADGTPSGRLGRLDPRTGKLDAFPLPKGMAEPTISLDEDGQGNIWASTPKGAVRFEARTEKYTEFLSVTQPGPSYGMAADRHGNGWWTQMGIDIIGFTDVKTGTVKEFRLPLGTHRIVKDGDLSPADLKMYPPQGAGRQQPRRPADDPNSDDIWFPNYAGQTLLRINSQTLKTTFYNSPRYGVNPYMAGVDSGGSVWMNLQNSDGVAKFDPKAEQWTFYSWPSRGTSPRGLRLMDSGGTLQLGVVYWNGSRAARMVIRTQDEVNALRQQARTGAAE